MPLLTISVSAQPVLSVFNSKAVQCSIAIGGSKTSPTAVSVHAVHIQRYVLGPDSIGGKKQEEMPSGKVSL